MGVRNHMSNLVNFNNLYANLAESAYNDRPKNFPSKNNKLKEIYIDYAQDHINKKTKLVDTKGGTHLPNKGIVYLQPDKTLHTEEVKTILQVPNPNGGYHKESYHTQLQQKTRQLVDYVYSFYRDINMICSVRKNLAK